MKRRMIAAALCLALLLSGCGGRRGGQERETGSGSAETETTEGNGEGEGGDAPMSFNTEQPAGMREGALSLNGEWGILADAKEEETVCKADDGSGTERVPLGGRIYGMKLVVPELAESDYVKARAFLELSPEAVPAGESAGISVQVRLNGGEWIGTDVEPYGNGTPHWVNLRLRKEDLLAGENRVEITSNGREGVWLLGNPGEHGYERSEAGETPGELDYSLRLRSVSHGEGWTAAMVPAAAEGQFEVSYADRVYPETYNGVVWYRKTFDFNGSTEGIHQWLCFNGVDYKADVWLNGQYLGGHEGGYTDFSFCVTDGLSALLAGENTLMVRVADQDWNNGLTEDDIHIKETLAGFAQDTRGLNYCGIWQGVYLEPRGIVSADDIYLYTLDHETKETELWLTLYNPDETAHEVSISVSSEGMEQDAAGISETALPGGRTRLKIPLAMGKAELWSPKEPNLYELTVKVETEGVTDVAVRSVGLSAMEVSGNQLLHNGEPIFLTGMLHWGSYYENYTSAVEEERVEKELLSLRAAGFNAVKYCLVSPPEYVLDLCDRLGLYVYIEYPIWNPNETEVFFENAYLQMQELVEKDRIHPSVVMTDFQCEDLEFSEPMDRLMAWCVEMGKETDPNRLFTDNSSNGEHRYGDFAACHPYYQIPVFEDMLEGWVAERGGKPLILGEYADISVLRDIKELNGRSTEQYTWYHEYFGDIDSAEYLREAGYGEEQIDQVIAASVENAQELRKYYLEAAKSCEGVAGLFLTHIFESPNGWADGWFDDLYEPHFEEEVIAMAAGETALLLPRDTVNYRAGQVHAFTPGISLYGGYDLLEASLRFELLDGERVVSKGNLEGISLENGSYYEPGRIEVEFPRTDAAVQYVLRLTLTNQGETAAVNEWKLWGYPEDTLSGTDLAEKKVQVYDPANRLKLGSRYPWMSAFGGTGADLVVATELNGTLLGYLSGGGTVIYAGSGTDITETVENWDYNRFSFAFLPEPEHPLTASLQCGGYGGLQFADLATASYLAGAENGRPLIGRFGITDGSICSYLSEYQVGQGVLLQTTLRLDDSEVLLGGGLLTHESLAVKGENVLGAYLLEQMIRYELER